MSLSVVFSGIFILVREDKQYLACCQGSKPLLGPFSDTESYF